ncbi:MAG: hypothetical protein LC769_00630 [Chloroflexi bacterium]|nr:hypothetical protein [Chloroflexota bacterium]
MSVEQADDLDVRIQQAVNELQDMIKGRYPTTSFAVGQGDDPSGTYVVATVDIDDPDDVMDLIIDRLVDIQVEDGLPVYVVPVRTEERVLRELQSRAPSQRPLVGTPID